MPVKTRGGGVLYRNEAAVTKSIRSALRCIGAELWHFKHFGGPLAEKGIPDLIGCYKGRFFAIEVKREKGGVVSEHQERQIEAIRRAGGIAIVARNAQEVYDALGIPPF
jgi:RecB family endonuclease NucS